MTEQNGKITSKQLMILIIGFVQGSVLLISFMDNIVNQDAWIVIIFAFLLIVPFVLSYAFLAKKFKDHTFTQMNDTIYGPWLGKIITLFYITNFLWLLSLNALDISGFYASFIMTDTPRVAFLVLFILVSAYCIKNGIENLARISIFAVVFITLVVIFTFLFLLGEMDFGNFLPILSSEPMELIQGTHVFATIPFGEVVVFLTIMPHLKEKKHVAKYTFYGLAFAALTLFVISVRNTAVLGSAARIYNESSYQTVRIINVWDILNRVELVVAINFTLAIFIKVSVLYYATISTLTQLLRLRSFSTLILPVGAIVIVMALTSYPSNLSHVEFATDYHIFYMIIFELIPVISLIVAKIRKLPQREASKQCCSSQ